MTSRESATSWSSRSGSPAWTPAIAGKLCDPRLVALEDTIKRTGARTTKVITEELSSLGKAVRQLRDEIACR
jgi:hypothetical protein